MMLGLIELEVVVVYITIYDDARRRWIGRPNGSHQPRPTKSCLVGWDALAALSLV
jgi:hypothetical protein